MTVTTIPMSANATRHVVRSALVILFWAFAAALVVLAHRTFAQPGEAVAAKAVGIVVVSFLYMKLAAPEATLDHALFTGVAWLVLAIAAEIVIASRVGHSWYDLLGSPASALRNVMMFTWVLAPALFARSRS